ncbi:MAG: hypothetical protein ACE5OZ_23250 [Candidatus Heimdallarchaeota archaeon]
MSISEDSAKEQLEALTETEEIDPELGLFKFILEKLQELEKRIELLENA